MILPVPSALADAVRLSAAHTPPPLPTLPPSATVGVGGSVGYILPGCGEGEEGGVIKDLNSGQVLSQLERDCM